MSKPHEKSQGTSQAISALEDTHCVCEKKKSQEKVYFNIFCIDKRFDALSAEYFKYEGFNQDYYLGTTAGACLSLGYNEYCKKTYSCSGSCKPCKPCELGKCEPGKCNPENFQDIELLKTSLIRNIEIAQTLDTISEIYLLNHQDCGAIRAFLPCSGYPKTVGENNSLEIKINIDLLIFAKDKLKEKFPKIKVRLGLIDINGSVADYNEEILSWNFIYRGNGEDPRGLWYKKF